MIEYNITIKKISEIVGKDVKEVIYQHRKLWEENGIVPKIRNGKVVEKSSLREGEL